MATIMIFAGNFAPQGWLFCDGSLQSIAQYDALFSLLGTTYGGDGQTTFALPDLRGRIPVGTGTGAGLGNVSLGEMSGTENVTLNGGQLPAHSHLMTASVGTSSASADGSKSPAKALATTPFNVYAAAGGTNPSLGGATVNIGNQGNNAPINIVQSYQAINYVICVEGIYPSRS
jgi:microcystin-dependent protein